MGILPARIVEWVALSSSRGSSQGIKLKSPSLQSDSLPSKAPGKPKNTGMGSLSLPQRIFPTQDSNWGLLHCRQILVGEPNQNHMRYQSTSTRIAIIKREKKEHVLASLRPSYSAVGDVKWFSHSGKVEKYMGVSQKVKYGITMQPNNSKYNLERIKNRYSDIRLPRWLSGKKSTCQCRRRGFDPWVRKIPWRRKWQPTLVFLPGKSHGQRILVDYSPWSRRATPEILSMANFRTRSNIDTETHIHSSTVHTS